ncbi:exopolyphosphatase [Corynebacterium macginleyi]|uniref:exopolyphosphatase n=1 Tax=Corynebacterium macginleyi TaxID=38290 RepID=UPI00190DE44E|nr:exopolyphosphatase [Corynebacterium macginleyi]QRJ57398.1 exopolyphosphatase [Corynebacterium macginleyi]
MDNGFTDGSAYDTEIVRFFDIAHEGAQIRLLAGQLERWGETLNGLNPRSLVILPTDAIAREAAHLGVGLAEPLRIPLVVTESLPQYVGAFDIVVVVGEPAECEWASRALIAASQRGATTILVGPTNGPLVEDCPEDTVIAPTLPTVEGCSPARFIMALYALCSIVHTSPHAVREELEDIAAAVDREIEQLSPERDDSINPGRQLREYSEGARIIHSCVFDPYAYAERRDRAHIDTLVARMAATIWAVHGLPGTFVEPADLRGALDRDAESSMAPAPVDDLFYDPFIDGAGADAPLIPLKVIFWGQEEANLPNSFTVRSYDSEPGLGLVARSLQLITRSFAATAYEVSKGKK